MISYRIAPLRAVAAAGFSLLLAACGGGGDGGCTACALLAAVPSAAPVAEPEPAPWPGPSTAPPASETPDPVPTVPPPGEIPEPPPTASPPSEPAEPPAAPPRYVIGGSVAGLALNAKLSLLDNGSDTLTVATDGAFRFAAPVPFNNPYAVTVGANPLWQNCSINNGNGTATADVRNVEVSCAATQAQVSTFAGSATKRPPTDGLGTAASFMLPQALTVDAAGNTYVADAPNIRKITPEGAVTTIAGDNTQFVLPSGVAVDADGTIYVADSGTHMISKISPSGLVTLLAGSTRGSADGAGPTAQFSGPSGLAVDASGNLYVADYGNNMIRKITPDGVVTTLAGSPTAGSADGVGANASFSQPDGVSVDAQGNVYVADRGNNLIRKITPDGLVSSVAGSTTSGFADGTGADARFDGPVGIAVDADGYLYVGDRSNRRVRRITPGGVVTTLAGSSTAGSADGIGADAQFRFIADVAVNATGDLYVISSGVIRKISPVR